jgi:hypothetical protein
MKTNCRKNPLTFGEFIAPALAASAANAKPVKIIKIRHQHVETAAKVCRINFKPGCWLEDAAQLALNAEAQKIFTSRPERDPV